MNCRNCGQPLRNDIYGSLCEDCWVDGTHSRRGNGLARGENTRSGVWVNHKEGDETILHDSIPLTD